MAGLRAYILFSLVLHSILFINPTVRCLDDQNDLDDHIDNEDTLLMGMNNYRVALNLPTFVKNESVECFAEEIADLFENRPCNNTSGTKLMFSDYPNYMAICNMSVTNTTTGVILPSCVANLVPTLVLSNFTRTNYSTYLNSTNFTTVGIGSEDNWIVVVLVADVAPLAAIPPTRSSVPAGQGQGQGQGQTGTSTGSILTGGLGCHLVILLVGGFLMI